MGARLYELNTGPNILKEKELVKQMIELYCHKEHHHEQLCNECQELRNYCLLKLSFCRFGENKPTCSNCKVYCFSPIYRQKMDTIIRYLGPWLLVYHPIFIFKYVLNK
ncbi:nitrous oxide-stimulated promoter family protein [Neobacillus mesonae]|uniref:nitrous oxide-stimulated promoter family protein n=1 Tax=Neobacillus mesonae TaxID=1193713 RepID=UPI00203B5AF1|nr:nitrous oxide-stimulated promoter family protein [Neobacillus mesonae]MCM3569462.1 nitrous oxide-stimulated promoter family protein [Neobacillus mesonae]